jgi:hypothetical protein
MGQKGKTNWGLETKLANLKTRLQKIFSETLLWVGLTANEIAID